MTETTHEIEQEVSPDALDLESIFEQVHAEIEEPKDAQKQRNHNKKEEKQALDEDNDKGEETENKPEKQETEKHPEKKETVDYKAEYEKLQKISKDTQKSFHENRKQLAAYKKAVEKLKSEGVLMDEEANMLLDHTHFEDAPSDVPVLVKYGNIWDKEMQYMRKYSPNPDEIKQHALAFRHLMQSTSYDEAEEILDELSNYEDDEIELTKRMLEIGRQYNEDIYADIHEAGNIRNLKHKYEKKQKELQERLDKMEKKYNKLKEKYEDYNSEPSDYRLPSGGTNVPLPKNDKIDLGAFFDSLA